MKSLVYQLQQHTGSIDHCIEILTAPLEGRARTYDEKRILLTLRRLREAFDGN